MPMELALQVVEDLAPDQSSLGAAKKLLNTSHWPMLGQSDSHHSIWGQCKGSGANPYLTMADVVDHGYKCTCPSRKFPCKHVLALLWMYSQSPAQFIAAEPTEWVHEWLARRRRPSGENNKASTLVASDEAAKPSKSIAMTDVTEAKPELDEQSLQRKQAQQQQRAEQLAIQTQHALLDGLQELDLWIQDQLRTGILELNKALRERTRRIAARMVDAKASALASRIDELTSLVRDVPPEQQPPRILQELGCWLLLSRAFQLDPTDCDAKRALVGVESRTNLIANDVGQVTFQGRWLCIGEQISNRRDGLISHSSYLWPLDSPDSKPMVNAAHLQDFYPAATGRRQGSLRAGSLFDATVQFYPSRWLQRATLMDFKPIESSARDWNTLPCIDIRRIFVLARQQLPWLEHICAPVGPCQLQQDAQGHFWLTTDAGVLPLAGHDFPAVIGGDLYNAAVRWDGHRAQLLTAFSSRWGVIAC